MAIYYYIDVSDALVIEIMSKLIKQRKESIKSYLEGKEYIDEDDIIYVKKSASCANN